MREAAGVTVELKGALGDASCRFCGRARNVRGFSLAMSGLLHRRPKHTSDLCNLISRHTKQAIQKENGCR
jgi:hypothetical protein